MKSPEWIKIQIDVFNDEKIKIIETFPAGETVILIWFRLLCLTGKINLGGQLLLSEKIPIDEKILATLFGKTELEINFALSTFEKLGMIEYVFLPETDTKIIQISNWMKHQNVDALEKIREQNRERKRKHDEQKKQQTLMLSGKKERKKSVKSGNVTGTLPFTNNHLVTGKEVTDSNVTGTLPVTLSVTHQHESLSEKVTHPSQEKEEGDGERERTETTTPTPSSKNDSGRMEESKLFSSPPEENPNRQVLPLKKNSQSKNEEKTFSAIAMEIPEWLPFEDWKDFVQHRIELRIPLTETGATRAISTLKSLLVEGHSPTDVIGQTILNNYRGLFPLKKADRNSYQGSQRKTFDEMRREQNQRAAREFIEEMDLKEKGCLQNVSDLS